MRTPCDDVSKKGKTMSMYRGNASTLHPVFENGAWTIYDKFGPFDGPYETEGAAWRVIGERAKWERDATPHALYVGVGL